ncbi:hypothetical protein JHK82_019518 [Glycine max]|nr:hypothetical protein JHK85_019957 [Glycine max]KHN42973.1 Glucan endo-1,3-beta-glucosidase [Glycine soja]KAG5038693.1 hypothetical protein JHK86_019533 [Glycine max]KAG5143823.1 hypothetical protein JHK82_019518 [Glycine max]KAH1088082.1 hypothetical protein GYH30_019231 [Glycine max]
MSTMAPSLITSPVVNHHNFSQIPNHHGLSETLRRKPILCTFVGTDISVTTTVPNIDIHSLSTLPATKAWLSANLLPFLLEIVVRHLAVRNEVLATSDKTLISHILPTMKSLHHALTISNLTTIQVSTPHSLRILSTSNPPSTVVFCHSNDKAIFAPILNFHHKTKSPFIVNPYPFFGFSPTRPESLTYALLKPNGGVLDPLTCFNYTNMFDAQRDAVFSAMKRLCYVDVELVVVETGEPFTNDLN